MRSTKMMYTSKDDTGLDRHAFMSLVWDWLTESYEEMPDMTLTGLPYITDVGAQGLWQQDAEDDCYHYVLNVDEAGNIRVTYAWTLA